MRAKQLAHLFTGMNIHECGPQKNVRAGDLCIFIRVDSQDKCLLGRIIQFSYLQCTKRDRQYSSDYVE